MSARASAAVPKRRSWLFVPGADEAAHRAAARSGADVIILELEDFTPPELRPRAPKSETPRQVHALEAATGSRFPLVPNIESAAALVRAGAIARASERVVALLLASEDMVADLGTERSRGSEELAYARARFLVECRAAGVEAIDCPYTFSDAKGAGKDADYARRLGYRMKSLVDPKHAQAVNAAFTPRDAEVKRARRIVAAFERARAAGRDRARVDCALIEIPVYAAAKRLLERDV